MTAEAKQPRLSTELHDSVFKGDVKKTFKLLTEEYPKDSLENYGDFKNVAPIHIAALVGSYECMQLLVMLGCDIDLKDGDGRTARHIISTDYSGTPEDRDDILYALHTAGAQRCTQDTEGNCKEGCCHDGLDNGRQSERVFASEDQLKLKILGELRRNFGSIVRTTRRDGLALLALDGGGVRGIVLLMILLVIEKEFQKLSGVKKQIVEYFGVLAGTSTGGIVTLALASGKSVWQTLLMYLRLKDEVFKGSRPHSTDVLEQFLKREFGPYSKLSSIKADRKVIIMSCDARKRPYPLTLYHNLTSPSPFADKYLWELLVWTSAAPYYFDLNQSKHVDGGMQANNPTLDSLTLMSKLRTEEDLPDLRASVIVSIGTAMTIPTDSSASSVNVGIPKRFSIDEAKKKLAAVGNLIDVMAELVTNAEGQVVERCRGWSTDTETPFYRFNPIVLSATELDETDDLEIIKLLWVTFAYIRSNISVLADLYDDLKKENP